MIKRGDSIESQYGTKGTVISVHWGSDKQVKGYCVQTEEYAAPVFVYAVHVKAKEGSKPYAN